MTPPKTHGKAFEIPAAAQRPEPPEIAVEAAEAPFIPSAET
jgi:hypothetical protein